MLKLYNMEEQIERIEAATFGWLCVETLMYRVRLDNDEQQPPSGGCVLKPNGWKIGAITSRAATFGWLCVETALSRSFCAF